ncbi:three component ABC system middle component [Halarcobacter anaerophilus]|uniref:Uncharacterized protein n=1 Tax=Halarcobacter anaerophilus TaxID=877500 RepID=A0A4Q0Y3A0_9BACT|nr:three component ABC system middle component [Halarcobacter anaerophilus]QDF29353.1 hypothetical protein AANAER_1880 [Halarcobacter anaerophilus]RXJ64600.1 hypothetical protein CRV06_01185 [Halarcobacter anaerophilus]
MSKYVDSIHKINNNIFVLTPLFLVFYKNLKPTSKNLLLSYLVLPLILYKTSQKKIKTSKKTSSIFSFLDSNKKEKRENVYGLQKRVQEYKEITNQCILYAIENKWLKLEDDLSIVVIEEQENNMVSLSDAFKASSKLCNIFKELDVISIYRQLGVKEL